MENGEYNVIGKNIKFGENVRIGSFVKIDDDVIIGNNVWIGSYVRIGRESNIGDNVVLKCRSLTAPKTVIEEGAFIGPQAMLIHEVLASSPNERVRMPPFIGKNAEIGSGAIIFPGVRVGYGAIVGAGAIVTRSVPAGSTVVGNPARRVDR